MCKPTAPISKQNIFNGAEASKKFQTAEEPIANLDLSRNRGDVSQRSKSIPSSPINNKSRNQFSQHNYHDHSLDVPSNEEIGEITFPKTKVNSFPLKFHHLLSSAESDGLAHVVSWKPHGRAFVVHKPTEFTEMVLPKYSKQTKLSSFQRQLNLYGFYRITRGRDKGAYYHELFLRGRAFLCNRMIRTKVKGTRVRAPSNPDAEPDFYAMMPVFNQVEKDENMNEVSNMLQEQERENEKKKRNVLLLDSSSDDEMIADFSATTTEGENAGMQQSQSFSSEMNKHFDLPAGSSDVSSDILSDDETISVRSTSTEEDVDTQLLPSFSSEMDEFFYSLDNSPVASSDASPDDETISICSTSTEGENVDMQRSLWFSSNTDEMFDNLSDDSPIVSSEPSSDAEMISNCSTSTKEKIDMQQPPSFSSKIDKIFDNSFDVSPIASSDVSSHDEKASTYFSSTEGEGIDSTIDEIDHDLLDNFLENAGISLDNFNTLDCSTELGYMLDQLIEYS